jgi:stalled ribosome rescue protein Dom34
MPIATQERDILGRLFGNKCMHMTSVKRLGVWMDHANAYLIEFTNDTIETFTIESASAEHGQHVNGSEKTEHHRQQQADTAYYKQLAAVIAQFEEVLLFGPTNAKVELQHFLKENHQYDHIKIALQQTDKMTGNQQHAFVRNYFSIQQ